MTMAELGQSSSLTPMVSSATPCTHDDDDGGGSSTKLPSSPAARAFFAALDEHQGDHGGPKRNSTKTRHSDFISKRIQTLGWRNRYSQQEQYPVSISISPRHSNKLKSTAVVANDDHADSHGNGGTSLYSFTVRQVQRGEVEGTYGTGATVWPASMVLLKYLERHAKSLIYNKVVIDLGAGTGITSIGAALLGAKRVICTDGEAPVVQLARDNMAQVVELGAEEEAAAPASTGTTGDESDEHVEEEAVRTSFELNGCPMEAQEYWWGTGTIHGMKDESNADLVVLVSDCVLPKLYPIAPLVEALDQLLSHSSSSVAILSYEHRHYPDYDPRDKFRELATAKNLQVSVIAMTQHDPVYSEDDIEIWHVTRK